MRTRTRRRPAHAADTEARKCSETGPTCGEASLEEERDSPSGAARWQVVQFALDDSDAQRLAGMPSLIYKGSDFWACVLPRCRTPILSVPLLFRPSLAF